MIRTSYRPTDLEWAPTTSTTVSVLAIVRVFIPLAWINANNKPQRASNYNRS